MLSYLGEQTLVANTCSRTVNTLMVKQDCEFAVFLEIVERISQLLSLHMIAQSKIFNTYLKNTCPFPILLNTTTLLNQTLTHTTSFTYMLENYAQNEHQQQCRKRSPCFFLQHRCNLRAPRLRPSSRKAESLLPIWMHTQSKSRANMRVESQTSLVIKNSWLL